MRTRRPAPHARRSASEPRSYSHQLDVYFAAPLSLFEKLLVAVVAEHALLATKLAVQLTFPKVIPEDIVISDQKFAEA